MVQGELFPSYQHRDTGGIRTDLWVWGDRQMEIVFTGLILHCVCVIEWSAGELSGIMQTRHTHSPFQPISDPQLLSYRIL